MLKRTICFMYEKILPTLSISIMVDTQSSIIPTLQRNSFIGLEMNGVKVEDRVDEFVTRFTFSKRAKLIVPITTKANGKNKIE